MNALLLATALAATRVLTLEEALQTAQTHQPALRQAAANTRAADARVVGARAPLLPQVNANSRYNFGTSNLVPQQGVVANPSMSGSTRNDSFTNIANGSLTISQLIWDFGQTWNRLQASQHSADAVGQDERAQLNSALYAVRSAFFAALASKQLLLVAQETLANQQRHSDQVKGFVEVGTRPEIDLAQARTELANARVALISAKNGYATARAALNKAMGVEGSTDYDISNDALAHMPEEDRPLDENVELALSGRPEVEALNARVRAQQENVAVARGAYGPSLSLSTGVTGGATNTGGTGNVTVVGINLSWNLFNGMGDWARVQEADANLTALLATADTLRQQVRFDVEQSQLGIHGAEEQLLAAGDALQAAGDRLRLAEGRYETGVGNIIELGDAQLAMTNAAAQKVRAEFTVSTARAQLLMVLGRP